MAAVHTLLLAVAVLVALGSCRDPSDPLRRQVTDFEFEQWLSTYRADDPAFQQECLGAFRGVRTSAAAGQHLQDVFIWRNLFMSMTILEGKRGFYVESGANHFREMSTSYFFDKCLGWRGLCVEPNPQYHHGHETHRSCTLIKECISDTTSEMQLHLQEANSFIGGLEVGIGSSHAASIRVQCRPLDAMLQSVGVNHVDLWVLDVEGYEMSILNGGILKRIPIDVMLIEDFWLSNRELDYVMAHNGFNKVHQMAVDSLYARRKFVGGPQTEWWWYPQEWQAQWEYGRQLRATYRAQGRLNREL